MAGVGRSNTSKSRMKKSREEGCICFLTRGQHEPNNEEKAGRVACGRPKTF